VTKRPPDPIDELLGAIPTIVGRSVTAEDRRLFALYLDLFLRWNKVYRMTALGSATAIVRDLFVDSLLFLKALPSPRPLAVVDIGAGAGIPGLVLRLADPGISITLLEARRKRVSFLLTACREMGLTDVAVYDGRAEDLVKERLDLQSNFDAAVARSVGTVDRLLPIARAYLKPGGVLVVSSSPGGHSLKAAAGIEVIRLAGPKGPRVFLRASI